MTLAWRIYVKMEDIVTTSVGYINASLSIPRGPTEEDIFKFVINVILMGMFCIFGLVCNTLSIVILQRDKNKTGMTILLQGLAVSDSLLLIYTFLYSTLRTAILHHNVSDWEHFISDCIVAYVLPFGWIAQTTSIWIVCLVTIDRYIAICHPFIAERHCTLRRCRQLLILVWTLSLAFNIPRFFYYHQMAFGDDQEVTSRIFVAHTDVTHDAWEIYHTVYHLGLTITFLFIIPLPILVILNVLLIREISSARRRQEMMQQRHNTRSTTDNIKTTLNLVVVISVFILCETPDFIASVLKISWINKHMDPKAMKYFMGVKELLLVINAATNFLIYCVFYAKFRRLLRGLCCERNTTMLYSNYYDTPRASQREEYFPLQQTKNSNV